MSGLSVQELRGARSRKSVDGVVGGLAVRDIRAYRVMTPAF